MQTNIHQVNKIQISKMHKLTTDTVVMTINIETTRGEILSLKLFGKTKKDLEIKKVDSNYL